MRARTLVADTRNERHLRAIGEELVKEGAAWAVALGHIIRAMVNRFDRETAIDQLLHAEEHLTAAGMTGWVHIARMRRAALEGGPGGAARALAARDFLKDLGAADPDRLAELLMPWPA
jgi:hypothetical protein